MGMRIGGGAGSAWATQNTSVGNWQQRQQNMKALGTALQSGDLATAQQAFATIAAGNPAMAANANSPLAKIGQALQSGDLAGAQQAAQAWRGGRHGDAAQVATNGVASGASATSSFLQTLTPLAGSTSAATPADSSVSGLTNGAQIAQALAAFERNLFDSLHAQDAAPTAGAASATSTASVADPTQAPVGVSASTAQPASAPRVGHHHHGGGDAKLAAELSSLIAQTASTASTATTASDPAATAAASPVAAANTTALDQSFKSLLTTLGVSGNNASLNGFLSAMYEKMGDATATQGGAAMA